MIQNIQKHHSPSESFSCPNTMLDRATILFLLLLLTVIVSSHGFVPAPGNTSAIRFSWTISSMSDSNPHFQQSLVLTSATVDQALAAAEQVALTHGFRVTIAISDAGGVPLLVKRLDGSFPASVKVAIGKAETAALFCKPTGQLESAVNVADGTSRSALLSAPFILMRGGLPIFLSNGVCVGAVGVSGVKPDEDEQVAMAAVDHITSLVSKL
jgi:glc operon protein GlcG